MPPNKVQFQKGATSRPNEWRYNRRFDLKENLVRQARVAAKTEPSPYRSIVAVRAPVRR